MDEIWEHEYGDAGDLDQECVTCGEEIEPGSVEYCADCKAPTHGDECLSDHMEVCTAALPPDASEK